MTSPENGWGSELANEIISRHNIEYAQTGISDRYRRALKGASFIVRDMEKEFAAWSTLPLRAQHIEGPSYSTYTLCRFDQQTGRVLAYSEVGVGGNTQERVWTDSSGCFSIDQARLVVNHARELDAAGLYVVEPLIAPFDSIKQ